MAGKGTIGKIIVLVLLILILIFASLFLFDYLGLINAKSVFSPVYSLFGLERTADSKKDASLSRTADLDADMLAKRLEALEIRREELDKKESDLKSIIANNKQVAAELDERSAEMDEREKSFQLLLSETNDRDANVRQLAIYMYNMRPQEAVEKLLALDDQDLIAVLRSAEAYSAEQGKNSPVSYWISLMPADRAGEIQRKMMNTPAIVP